MSEIDAILEAAAERRARGERMALATVVSVRGSSYRRPGARLLVPEEGSPIGLISGGCLEEEAARLAREALALDAPMLVTIDHSAEGDELWGMGLGCRGRHRAARGAAGDGGRDARGAERRADRGPADLPADQSGRRASKADRHRGRCARRAGGPGRGAWAAHGHRRGGARPDPAAAAPRRLRRRSGCGAARGGGDPSGLAGRRRRSAAHVAQAGSVPRRSASRRRGRRGRRGQRCRRVDRRRRHEPRLPARRRLRRRVPRREA